jgi:hypothetical protein
MTETRSRSSFLGTAAVAALTVATLKNTTVSLKTCMGLTRDCLPEMQAEMNSLTTDITGTGTAYITTDQRVSRHCTKFLYGNTGSGE